MAKPNWRTIRREWEETNITLNELAKKHKVPLGTLKSRKQREQWGIDVTDATKKNLRVDEEGLTDKQQLFCIYYLKSFNATSSAIKAGYSADTAHVQGTRLLNNARVREEIKRLKEGLHEDLLLDVRDVIAAYAKIAFADLSDFTKFGRKEIPYMTEDGPLEDENGNQIMQEVNYVDFRNWDEVDGTLITEVKNGKDGPVIKLADKMKALEMLTKYFDLLSERDKQKLQEEKLRVDIEKGRAETKRLDNNEDDSPIEIVISRKGER